MNQKQSKKMRREVRKHVKQKQDEIIDSFRKFINELTFKQRVRLAFKILTKQF